jgi:hypothetical protein
MGGRQTPRILEVAAKDLTKASYPRMPVRTPEAEELSFDMTDIEFGPGDRNGSKVNPVLVAPEGQLEDRQVLGGQERKLRRVHAPVSDP